MIKVRHIRKSEFALVFGFTLKTSANSDFYLQLSADGNQWHTLDTVENQPAGYFEREAMVDFDKKPFAGKGTYYARVLNSRGVRSGTVTLDIREYPKTVVALIVYNRLDNLQRWLHCWELCDRNNTELVVIHNQDEGIDRSRYIKLCDRYKVKYIARENKGYDIGALQDVCQNRLKGFPQYDTLLWVTDDTIPMAKNFVSLFLDKLSQAGVGVACTEISDEVTRHIRTSGFALRRHLAEQLNFPAKAISTKAECFHFEHLGGSETFFSQVLANGLKAEQVAELAAGPLWDMNHRHYLNRMHEHETVFFREEKKVTFICPVYQSFPGIIASLLMQTHHNWEVLLIHDGPADEKVLKAVNAYPDSRIKFYQTPSRAGVWGHSIRQWALEEIKAGRLSHKPDYVVITNADNYHVPVFCEYMIDGFKKNAEAVAVYCGKMAHSYIHWGILECEIKLGFVDCAGVMVKAQAACEVGWRDITGHSSDWTYFNDLQTKYGKNSFQKVEGCLLIHN